MKTINNNYIYGYILIIAFILSLVFFSCAKEVVEPIDPTPLEIEEEQPKINEYLLQHQKLGDFSIQIKKNNTWIYNINESININPVPVKTDDTIKVTVRGISTSSNNYKYWLYLDDSLLIHKAGSVVISDELNDVYVIK
jgi:hypothetical protein